MRGGASRLAAGIQSLVGLVYPGQCLTCEDRVEQQGTLCGACWRDTPFIFGLVCDSCGTPLPGTDPGHAVQCDECLGEPRAWGRGRAAMLYRGNGRKLVLGLKHGDRTHLAGPAARWMARAAAGMLDPEDLLVPVPAHWSRLVSRRYSQSALLALALARHTGNAVQLAALQRGRRTKTLDGLGRSDRYGLLDGAIQPHPRHGKGLWGRRVVLIDDVLTSGATLTASAKAARQAGATGVQVLVLARVAKDG